MRIGLALAVPLFIASLTSSAAPAAEIGDKNFTADDLFQMTRIWKVELTFTPEQWTNLAPRKVSAPSGSVLTGAPGLRNGLQGAAGMEYEWVHADLKIDGLEFKDIAVRYKGNGTYQKGQLSGKISFKLALNKYVKGQKLAKMDKLNLANEISDSTWMNENISYKLFRDAGIPAPRTAYARVFITITGQKPQFYRGLYSLVEEVDPLFLSRWFPTKDGALFKPVMPVPFTFMGEDWEKYKQSYDPKVDLTDEQKKRMIDFTRLIATADDATFAKQIGDYIDIDETARFLAVSVYAMDYDSILLNGQNYYVYQDTKTNRYSFTAWDQDETFAKVGFGYGTLPDLSIVQPHRPNNRFLVRLFALEAFRTPYLKAIAEFSNTIFNPESLAAEVDLLAAAIRPAVKEESESALAMFDAAASGDSFFSPLTSSFILPLKSFAQLRKENVTEQLTKIALPGKN